MNIHSHTELRQKLIAIEGNPCADYQSIAGTYQYTDFTLIIEYIPAQPELAAARLRIAVPLDRAKFPKDVFSPKSREIAARDFMIREFTRHAVHFSMQMSGMHGGTISLEKPGQEMLESNALVIGENDLEIRCMLELPVIRKHIPTSILIELFMKRIPGLVKRSLTYGECDGLALVRWIELAEDADTLRSMLDDNNLAAFIANGSMLAWKGPRERRSIVPLEAPEELAVTLTLPNRGEVTGLGIPKGITVITGGWRQGKTTLLRALSHGVYNHIPGDGRELAVTAPDAVTIAAEEGRRIERVDLSPILPPGPDEKPGPYSTSWASPAVSMAANIMEALEIGTSLLLFDDETSALPLASFDIFTQSLTGDDRYRPRALPDILPLLRDHHGISSVVVGGSAELYAVADTVILMDRYRPCDVTTNARKLIHNHKTGNESGSAAFSLPRSRSPLSRSLAPLKLDKKKTQPSGRDIIPYGDDYIDLSRIPQLVSKAQARAIGRAIALVDRLIDGSPSLADAVGKVMNRVSTVGLDTLSNRLMGDLAMFRPQELAAAINRMRQLSIK